ncbi:TetR family transcriptional regulator [Actinoplanes sp. NPDC024001]|uniref:TetR/AcrR family transcriptional regulator n=1 Tax=Actinoplanes sp. NPDC024001 TaxID=3154598 RepID=UPI0033C17EB8
MPSPRRSPPPSARQRDPERTRRRILEAAAVEFGAHGFAGARIRAIAARAGVNQQLVSYYFDGKEGLYQAMSQQWQQRRSELVPAGTPMPEQVRRYAREVLSNPAGVRVLAWSGLEYSGAGEHGAPPEMFEESLQQLRDLQAAGRLAAEVDPVCLLVMLMSAAMATTTLPHVIESVSGADPRSAEFVEHYADQLALVARLIGLEAGPA